jgi:uncharacterized membrane protein HdeD (DUF308 family)
MSTTPTPPPSSIVAPTHTPAQYDMTDSVADNIERGTWFDFAALILGIVGALNIIDGIAGIRNSRYLVDTHLFANTHAWGWFFLIWGVIQIFAAFAVYRGAGWGIVLAIATVGLNAIAQLSNARSYPVWSITILALDILVMYGLIVHRNRPPTRY